MALDESAVADLIDALAVGEGTDLVRELARWALQELIELEAAEVNRRGSLGRSPERVTHRNGLRRRVLSTKAGDLEVGIPSCARAASFPRSSNRVVVSTRPVCGGDGGLGCAHCQTPPAQPSSRGMISDVS